MEYQLDLSDIQGIILRGYRARFARFAFLHIEKGEAGRRFLKKLLPWITTAVDIARDDTTWKPHDFDTLSNVAMTHAGLKALQVPLCSLDSFAPELKQGMRARAGLLGDDGVSSPENWDPLWQPQHKPVHLMVTVNAWHTEHLEQRYDQLQALVEECDGGLSIVGTQDGGALDGDREHFGFLDGVSDPYMAGMSKPPGTRLGKLTPDGNWKPLAAGEFLLGRPDEGQETLDGPIPYLLARNGSYLVFRKLHQNVGAFRDYIEQQGRRYPGGKELLAAKMMGRWPNGTSLIHAPKDPSQGSHLDNDFLYADDPEGIRCPQGSHVRRMNPRDELGFRGKLVNRHRILRRGISYGEPCPPGEACDDRVERGLIFIAINANIERQFEFLQREWLNNGNDFRQGNDKDPISGNGTGRGRMLIPGDPDDLQNQPTWLCADMPRFVEMRGGEYFFLPSMTALRRIAAAAFEDG